MIAFFFLTTLCVSTNCARQDRLFPKRTKTFPNGTVLTDDDIMVSNYASSHGVTATSWSTLQIVFDLISMYRPDNCVVIGTGTGLAPRVIREAQVDSGKVNGTTYLVDLGFSNGAMPDAVHDADSIFRQLYPEIVVFKNYSVPFGFDFIKRRLDTVDILWIDGDHSYRVSKLDFDHYSQLVTSDGLIFMHDVAPNGESAHQPEWCGVDRTISEIKATGKFEVLQLISTDKRHVGMGTAIIRRVKNLHGALHTYFHHLQPHPTLSRSQ